MTDIREDMTKAIEGQIAQLGRLRQCPIAEAAIAVSTSFSENLRDSRGTQMESYWQAMSDIARDIVAAELGERR